MSSKISIHELKEAKKRKEKKKSLMFKRKPNFRPN
jgi:hypothetical protein